MATRRVEISLSDQLPLALPHTWRIITRFNSQILCKSRTCDRSRESERRARLPRAPLRRRLDVIATPNHRSYNRRSWWPLICFATNRLLHSALQEHCVTTDCIMMVIHYKNKLELEKKKQHQQKLHNNRENPFSTLTQWRRRKEMSMILVILLGRKVLPGNKSNSFFGIARNS